MNTTITAIPGILAGHASDLDNQIGCTAILCPEGFTPGVHLPGFAPGSRETDLLRPESTVEEIHGITLCGGSAFGLSAADGVVQYLFEQGCGLPMPHARIPLVSAAVIYDLDMNKRPGKLPDADMGYRSAVAASSEPLTQGSLGAGCGARCGRMFAFMPDGDHSAKSGLGTALAERAGLLVAAVAVANPLGNILDPVDGSLLAGGRDGQGMPFSRDTMCDLLAGQAPQGNTVICVVATNAPLNKLQTNRLARMASAGLPRTIYPAHLTFDGDLVFALASRRPLDGVAWTENLVGAMAADVLAQAVANAARFA